MFVALLFILMVSMAAFSFLKNERPTTRSLVFMGTVGIITLMAALRPLGIDKDSLQYYSYYLGQFDDIVEPSFILIRDLVQLTLDDVQGVFIAYALLAIPLKCFVFTKLSDEYFLLLAVYMSNFLILHDMTQIRVGAAMAFIFLGFYCLTKEQKWLCTLFVLVATFFHVSAILLLVMVFFSNKDLKMYYRVILAIIPCLAFASVLFDVDLISLIPFDFVQDKLKIYEEIKDNGTADVEKVNIFNAGIMVKMAVYYFVLWKYDTIKPHCDYLPLLLKLFALSYICLGVFNFIAVFATRISELYGFVEILMVPLIIHAIEPKWTGRIFVLIYTVGIFLLNVVYADLLTF